MPVILFLRPRSGTSFPSRDDAARRPTHPAKRRPAYPTQVMERSPDQPCPCTTPDINRTSSRRASISELRRDQSSTSPSYARFHALRNLLRDAYLELLNDTAAGRELGANEASLRMRRDLLFTLVEGAVLTRRGDPSRSTAELAQATADVALRIAGVAVGRV